MLLNGKEYLFQVDDKTYHCSLAITADYIGGKWKMVVLWYLQQGKKRYGALRKLMPDVTERMLSIQLKQLEEDGLIKREVFTEKPPLKVEYSLTPLGETLVPILDAIALWGRTLATEKGQLIEK